MKIAVVAMGVTSVAMEGELKDEIVVIGDGVDAVSLVNAVRKKACYASLESLEEVKKKPQVDDKSITQQCPLVSCEQGLLPHKYEKICIKLSTNCAKCKRKAMEVAVVAEGVISVAIEGELEDELLVVGDGVDATCLVDALRKKVCYATLETLEEVKPNILPADDDQIMPQKDNDKEKSDNIETADGDNGTNQVVPPQCCLAPCSSSCYQQPPLETYEVVVYDSYGPYTGCTTM